MMSAESEILKPFARKYVWWKTPEEAVVYPRRVVAQVMNIGDYDDMQALIKQIGEDAFRNALQKAEIGEFNARSWHYWHYRLGLSAVGQVPPMPVRKLG